VKINSKRGCSTGRVLGDKAYSSRAIRAYLRRRRIQATIPEPADQKKNRLRRGRTGGCCPPLSVQMTASFRMPISGM